MKKVTIIALIIILITGFQYSAVFAENNITEKISCRIPDYDITDEYKLEIKDNKDTKIVVIFKDMTIIDSYSENNNGKLDLKSLTKITYSEPNDTHFLYIDNLTDSNYQLDYTKSIQYSVYVNDKLKKEVETKNAYVDKNKGIAIFSIEYDKKMDMSDKSFKFGQKVFMVNYIVILFFIIYMKYYGMRRLDSKKYGGIINEKNINYCREIPDSIDLELAYASLYCCSKISTKKLKNGIIGAFILKWSNDNNVIISDKGNKVFSIDLKDGNFNKTDLEQELYDLLKIAAGDNNIIDNTELKLWSRSHKDKIERWHKKLLTKKDDKNLITEAELLLGLKKFLLDYSLIEERRHIEVKVWEEYLIYAQILGIADEVAKQFVKIYPDYSKIGQLSVMNMDELVVEIIFIRLFFLLPMGIAILPTIIISWIYYIINLL